MDISFEELYRGHHADVFRVALRELGNVHDAEDVTQAAFVDAYRAVLRGSRPEAPRAWLLAIAENVRRRRYRTAQRRPREEPTDDADFPLQAELSHERARALAEALAELPPEQRRVFVLRELGGLSYDEIAGETGSTVGAIQMLLFRARRTLRELLEPPVSGRRRTGFLVPLPGWLTTFASRADLATTQTPRAVGAVGATVVAVLGASVAVSEIGADGAPGPSVDPRPPAAASLAADPVVNPAARRPTRAVRVAVTPRASTPASRTAPVRRAQPAPAPAPAAAAGHSPSQPPRKPPPVVERPRLPVRVDEPVRGLLEKPGVPPLPTASVLEAVTGAAGAAGANAPPLPVPDVPSSNLPPVP